MENEYEIASTSNVTWDIRDVVLQEGQLTRKVLRGRFVKNPKSSDNKLNVCLVHQRRKSATHEWEDLAGPSLQNTTFATPSKFQLDTAETHSLLDVLVDLYQVDLADLGRGQTVLRLADEDRIIETDASRAALVRKLLETNHGNEIWQLLVELEPDLVSKLEVVRRLETRRADLAEFEAELQAATHDENWWKRFLKRRPWMLGSSHIDILDEDRIDIKHYADVNLKSDGGFMDVIELKRPDTKFWATEKATGKPYRYRDKFLIPYWELDGAISQLSNYILQAEKRIDSKDFEATHGVVPLRPRGLVIHGRSNDWGDREWIAHRLLNSRLHGIQVMTFDQVLTQARRLLTLYEAELPS